MMDMVENMMDNMTDWIVQNKDNIEKGVEMIGKAAEVLASTVGDLHPVLMVIFKGATKMLTDPEGEDAKYLTQQFEQVSTKLKGIEKEMEQMSLQLKRMEINVSHFDNEASMLSQYEKFQDFINAKPKFKGKKKDIFIAQFENTGGTRSVDALYDAVTGDNLGGVPILETIVKTEGRSRRAVEEFCARLKKLFVYGIIAVMGHAALKDGNVGEDMVKTWLGRMKDVEIRMKAAVDECIEKFPEQAEKDMNDLNSNSPPELLKALDKKYDWVKWSIRAFKDQEHFFFRRFVNWIIDSSHGSEGTNSFTKPSNNTLFVFSYCVDPKPLNKTQIQEQIQEQKLRGKKPAVASALRTKFPNYLVHAISTFKAVEEVHTFPEDCFYYEKFSGCHLYIHPE